MKTIEQLENEIKEIKENFNNNRIQFEMRRNTTFKDEKKEQDKEKVLMSKRNDLERQKDLLKDLIALGVVKEK